MSIGTPGGTTTTGRARLAIFARAPVPGQVKQRLAATMGDQAALSAHVALVEDTLQRLHEVPGATTELWLTGAEVARVSDWCRRWRLPLRRQRGSDLGARMSTAIAAALAGGEPGLVVGCDCPPVTADYVARAIRSLLETDVVLGPALDGGYALVGLARDEPDIFQSIAWGTSKVLEQTLTRADAAGLSVTLLEPVWDVDTEADWRRFQAGR
ncbi:MAG: TIGR04282 family arsenosugar biosynthesis glycosyltransferase [Pseudomonadales bacterium]